LLEQPDTTDPKELRHLAILALMYDTGCRVQELADLTIESLRIQYKPCSIKIYGKGRKTRIVPLSEHVVDILTKYMGCLYILIKKYPTFQSKSIPLTNLNGTTPFIKNDKYVYKTGDHNQQLPRWKKSASNST
jgi:site-specific recombinase XerD